MKIFSVSHALVRGRVDIKGHGEREIVDMSSLGVLVRDEGRGLGLGAPLDFELLCEELRPLSLSGVLAEHLEVDGTGVSAIEFLRCNPAHRRLLTNFIHTQTRRRVLPRVPLEGTLRVRGNGAYEIVDISETGILARTPDVLSPGTVIHFQLESPSIPASPLSMAGVIVRSLAVANEAHTVIEMIRVNPAHRDLVKAALEEAIRRGGQVR